MNHSNLVSDPSSDVAVLQQSSSEDLSISVSTSDHTYKCYAVFDGHGNPVQKGEKLPENHVASVAKYRYKNLSPLHTYIKNVLNFYHGQNLTKVEGEKIKNTIIASFLSYDKNMKALGCIAGCCASMVIIISDSKNGGKYVYICNLGDSRVCFWVNGGNIVYQTRDHTPSDEDEYERVIRAGGFIKNNRVNGSLAVTRAFGDWDFKTLNDGTIDHLDGPVTALPEIKILYFPPQNIKYRFMVTSDGAYEGGANCEYLIETGEVLEILCSRVTSSLVRMLSSSSTDDITIMFRYL